MRSTDTEIRTKVNDKRDDFILPMVNLPFLSSIIPGDPTSKFYISQLMRYSRTCYTYDDFAKQGMLLTYTLVQKRHEDKY